MAAAKKKAPRRGSKAARSASARKGARTRARNKAARKAARKTDQKWLLACILFEQSDWKELAENADAPLEGADQHPQMGFLDAYPRLAGNVPAFV